jgi:hypothetical protein
MRIASLDILVDFVQQFRQHAFVIDVFQRLIDIIVNVDEDRSIRYHLARKISTRPPFVVDVDVGITQVNTRALLHRLWSIIVDSHIVSQSIETYVTFQDSRLRGYLIDAYVAMYGRGRPTILSLGTLDLAKARLTSALHL